MAKFGEGDKRWIVEERPDGANVHNWHWSEKDCLEWSRTQLATLLSDLVILNGQGNLFIKILKLDKLEGEAYVNIRKGKIIPGYEISVTLSWEGEAKESDGSSLLKSQGTVQIPYIADENADEDPELIVSFNDSGPLGKRLRDAFLEKGKPLILEKVRVYVQKMSSGGPGRDDLDVKRPSTDVNAPYQVPLKSPMKVERKEKGKQGFKTISVTEKFRCRARYLFEILMDENRWKGFTQSNAKISKDVGGEFMIFDGSVTGTIVELQEDKLIVQKWRFGSWADGIYSTVTFSSTCS